MAERIRIDPEHLLVSASRVNGHAEELKITHTAADTQIESALGGWSGTSLTAMTAKAAEWRAATTAMSGRLFDHAELFHTSGVGFHDTEARNAETIRIIGSEVGRVSLGNL